MGQVSGPMNPIDLDLEAIQFDGTWMTREQLVSLITSKLDASDYFVSKPSEALEQLTATLAELRTLALSVTPQLADALTQAAARQGKTEACIAREAIMAHLGMSDTAAAPEVPPAMVARRSGPNRAAKTSATFVRPQ